MTNITKRLFAFTVIVKVNELNQIEFEKVFPVIREIQPHVKLTTVTECNV